MFDSLRDKFQTFQENLSTTLRGLSVNETSNRRQIIKQYPPVNLNAGADILERFQNLWFQLHEASQENALKADEADSLIFKLDKSVDQQWKNINLLTNCLRSLPEVVHSLNDLCNKVIVLEQLFDSVENALIELEDVIETNEFQNKQLDQRFKLALYKEKKLAALENVRVSLSEELAEKVRKHEIRQQRFSKEYQEACEENFKQDLKIYKETNMVPKIEFGKMKNSDRNECDDTLESITLDSEDQSTLDEFLNDSNELEKENDTKPN